jgi:hypothetical protein
MNTGFLGSHRSNYEEESLLCILSLVTVKYSVPLSAICLAEYWGLRTLKKYEKEPEFTASGVFVPAIYV